MLIKRAEEYHHLYKMRQLREAINYVEDVDDFSEKSKNLGENLCVTEWEILDIKIGEDSNEAMVEVIRSYYILPSVVIQTEHFTQKWKFKNQKWYLVGPY